MQGLRLRQPLSEFTVDEDAYSLSVGKAPCSRGQSSLPFKLDQVNTKVEEVSDNKRACRHEKWEAVCRKASEC